jgi:hypothetical protein
MMKHNGLADTSTLDVSDIERGERPVNNEDVDFVFL